MDIYYACIYAFEIDKQNERPSSLLKKYFFSN